MGASAKYHIPEAGVNVSLINVGYCCFCCVFFCFFVCLLFFFFFFWGVLFTIIKDI